MTAFGQEFKATADLNPGSILIGDQVDLSLGFSFPAGVMVAWPSIKDTILGKIQVINRSKIDTVVSADKKTLSLTQKLRLTCFDSGFYTIPPIRFYYRRLPDTTIRFEQTDIQILTVHTLTVDTTQAIKPIKGPVKVPFSIFDYIGWILGGIGLVAIAFVVFWYLRKRRNGEPVFVLRPAVRYQPHELALMDLEKLRLKKLWQAGRIKEYHTELTDILRKYIEARFRLMAMESTTAEILEDLKEKTAVAKETREAFGNILTLADLVKFAKYLPMPEEHEGSMTGAVDFVGRTQAAPVVPQPDAGAETPGSNNHNPVAAGEPVTKKTT
jgi:hypothetical protein